MAKFLISYQITMKHEGGYVNDPDDAGGETYKGISRRFNPSWKGWGIVDIAKDSPEWPLFSSDTIRTLDIYCEDFFKEHYWDPVMGDYIPDQEIAGELFDTAVNCGIQRAATFLQEALNILNKNEEWYEDVVVDGGMGSQTLGALESYMAMSGSDTELLLKVMNCLQANHYISYMKTSPEKEKFARGWLNNRVQFS